MLDTPNPYTVVEANPMAVAPYRLDPAALRLAVGFASIDPPRRAKGSTPLARIQAALWREDPEAVAAVYGKFSSGGIREGSNPYEPCPKPQVRLGITAPECGEDPSIVAARRCAAEKLSAGWVHPIAQAKLPRRKRNARHGVTVSELARRADVPREAMAQTLEHHGYLEMVPYGGCQKRRLMTNVAEDEDYGRNVDPSASRSMKLDGAGRAAPFPVFYPERVPELLVRLDFAGIREKVSGIVEKRHKLAWVMEHHPYLPNNFIATLTGYSEAGVRKARGTSTSKSASQVRIAITPVGLTERTSNITTNLEQTSISSSLEVGRDERPTEVLTLDTTPRAEASSEAEISVEAWCTPLRSTWMGNSHHP